MVEILMELLEDSLVPVDADGYTAIRQVPERSIVKVKFSVPRNIRQLRLYFAMINVIFDHQREPRAYPTRERLREDINIALGHCHQVKNLITGKVYTAPNSISFGAMDQIEWKEYFEAFKNLVFEKILPGVGSKDLEQQIADMLRISGPDQQST